MTDADQPMIGLSEDAPDLAARMRSRAMPTVPLWIPIVVLSAAALLILVLIVLKIGSLNAQSPIDRWREAARSGRCASLKKEKLIVPEDAPRRLRLGWVDSERFVKTANMRSLLVMAPSGSGKTPRVVVPNVLTHRSQPSSPRSRPTSSSSRRLNVSAEATCGSSTPPTQRAEAMCAGPVDGNRDLRRRAAQREMAMRVEQVGGWR